jgi:ATP-dependent Clp protease ATP-binding subunit ClpA
LRITTTAELLKAVELGIVDKTEARGMLGLPVKRGRLARLQPRQSGRFVKGELVYPLNRFSATARQALIQAQDFAGAEGRVHAETGDMLLALVLQADGAGARALQSIGVGEEQVRSRLAHVEREEDFLEGTGPTGQLKAVVETAFGWVGYPDQVGTWQLALALASCEGKARDVLAQLGVQEQALRAMTGRFGAGDDLEPA